MELNSKKLYKWPVITLPLVLILLGIILLFIIIPIVNAKVDLILITCSIPFIIAVVLLIVFGYLSPLYITPKGVIYRRQFIDWDLIEIVLVPRKEPNNKQLVYYIVVSHKDSNYREIKSQIFKGKWVFLYEESINCILQYYNRPILVLDLIQKVKYVKGEMKSIPKINKIIEDHNAKFDVK